MRYWNHSIRQTHKFLYTEFYVMCRKAAMLLGRKMSELLGVIRVGVSFNSCENQIDR